MKKIILLVFALLAIISFSIASSEISYHYIDDMLYVPSYIHQAQQFAISYSEDTANVQEFKNKLLVLAEKHQVSVMKYEKSLTPKNRIIYLYIKDKELFKDSGLIFTDEQLQSFNERQDAKITTNRAQENAMYFPKFPLHTVLTYENFLSSDNRSGDGDYIVYGTKSRNFLEDLKKKYAKTEFIENDTMSEQSFQIESPVNSATIAELKEYLFLLGIIMIVCLLMYFNKQEKKLAIEKLHGFSDMRMLIQENKSLFLELLGINLLVYACLMFLQVGSLHKYSYLLINYLLTFMLLELLMILIVFIFLYFYFRHITYSSILKNRKHNRSIFLLNFVLRVFILIYTATILTEKLPILINDTMTFIQRNEFQEEVSDYQSISYIAHNVSEENAFSYMSTLYQELNRQGAIGIELDSYMNIDEHTLPYIKVNANYINERKLLCKDGKTFQSKDLDIHDKSYLLVPETVYEHKKEQLIRQFDATLYEMIPIKDDQSIFTFKSNVKEDRLGVLHSPIIEVSGFINTDSIYITSDQLHTTELTTALKKQGFPEDIGFMKVFHREADMFQLVKRNMFDILKIVVIDLITLLMVLLQLVILFIHDNRKLLAIKKMNGYSLFKQYEDLFFIQVIFYAIIFFYFLLKGQTQTLIAFMGILVFEFFSTLLLIYFDNRKSSIQKLKEDETA